MTRVRVLDTLETDRLLLRQQTAEDAAVHREMWIERDLRVPPHRQMDDKGRPTVEDIAAQIRAAAERSGPGLLMVELKGAADAADVIGYCGLISHGNRFPEEPELAYELLRAFHGCGYATEAGQAVVRWADEAGYRRLWAGSGTGTSPLVGFWRSLGFAK